MPMKIAAEDASIPELNRMVAVEETLLDHFGTFLENAIECFRDGKPLAQTGGSVTGANKLKSEFTVGLGVREIKFCYSTQCSAEKHIGLVTVVAMPVHAEFEKAYVLGSFEFDEGTDTNLLVGSMPVSIESKSGARTILAHYLTQAYALGFCPQ